MPDANVPVLGHVNKGVLFAGAAAAAAVGGYLLIQHNKKKAATANTAANVPPQAYGYGSSAYGYGSFGYGGMSYPYPNASSYGYGAFGYGMYNPYTGGYNGAAGTPYPQTVSIATNQEWVQEALSALSAQGFTGQTVIGALALYVEGQPVSSSQEQTVQAAIAVAGYPPQPGATGYPPAINTGGAAGGGGQGGGGGGGTTTGRLSAPGALHVANTTPNSAQVAWNDVQGASGYTALLKKGGSNGQTVSGPFSTNGPFANFNGLTSKTKYTAMVWPNSGSTASGPGSSQPHSEVKLTTK